MTLLWLGVRNCPSWMMKTDLGAPTNEIIKEVVTVVLALTEEVEAVEEVSNQGVAALNKKEVVAEALEATSTTATKGTVAAVSGKTLENRRSHIPTEVVAATQEVVDRVRATLLAATQLLTLRNRAVAPTRSTREGRNTTTSPILSTNSSLEPTEFATYCNMYRLGRLMVCACEDASSYGGSASQVKAGLAFSLYN